jgi:hypothetical protein
MKEVIGYNSYLGAKATGKETFYLAIPDSGTGKYTFQVNFFKDYDELNYDNVWSTTAGDAITEMSDIFDYTKPSDSVSTPSVTVNSDGTVSWDEVDDATYLVRLYYSDATNPGVYIDGYTTPDLTVNFADKMKSGVEYAVNMRAISKDITKLSNSDWTGFIKFPIDTDDSEETSTSTGSEETTSSNEASVVATPQPTIGNSTGWDSLANAVDKAITDAVANAAITATATTTAVVNINLNGVDTVPATAINAIAGKDVVLSLSVDAKTLVTIDGSQLTAADVADVKLVSGKASDGSATLNVRTGNVNIEKSIVVYSNIGADKVGSEVSLYFVNADQSLVEFRTSPVYENGYAAFNTPLVNANYKIAVK